MDKVEFTCKPRSRIRRLLSFCVTCFALTIIASQCFAQSSAASSALTTRQYGELLNSVLDFVYRNYVDEVDPEVLYHGALKGMLEALNDPYTLYLDQANRRSLDDTTEGAFGGVVLSISKPFESTADKPAYVEVASPIEDTPGFRAGIQAGDIILSINGTDTSTINMEEVLSILRGKVGDPVDLVIRRGKTMEFPVTLVRALIETPTVKYGSIPQGKKTVGYIRIIEFTPNTAVRVQEALESFKKPKISSLIIDLRNNPGGLITSVADVADKFIDNGPIVTTKSRLAFENSVFTASPKKTTFPKGLPIIVLINKGSASASEILSGALKDYKKATLLGTKTYGKGMVQKIIPLPNETGLNLTVAKYLTPNGTDINKKGIAPDIEVKITENDIKTKNDAQLKKAQEILLQMIANERVSTN